MTKAVGFDLGNTLVSYYTREQWPGVLSEAIDAVAGLLERHGRLRVPRDDLPARVEPERGEVGDHRVRPLAGRLGRIFGLSADELPRLADEACQAFLAPTFAVARLHKDVLPTLAELRRRGVRTGILSNTPWGSPGDLWRGELARHGLLDAVDAAVFCTDVDWRKPDRRPFDLLCERLGVRPAECLFVGDDPRWDMAGPAAIGMPALLIDRTGRDPDAIRSLDQLLDRL